MPLTKKDLSQIKGLVHDEVESPVRMVAGYFGGVDKRKRLVYRDEFEEVLSRLLVVEKKLGIRSDKV